MLVYEKRINDEKHLYGTMQNVPSESDVELTYKDEEGTEIIPVSGDNYLDKSFGRIQRIRRISDNKMVNVFIGDTQIIGDEVTSPEPPVVSGYKHVIRMYANNGSHDTEFNATIENDDETEFTQATLEAWLSENGYTSAGTYYEEVETLGGPEVDGIASKSEGVVCCRYAGGTSGTNIDTFIGDTVTPANQ